MKTPKPVTAEQIQQFRELHGCSMHEAKQVLTYTHLQKFIDKAETFEELRTALRQLTDTVYNIDYRLYERATQKTW